MKRFRCLSAPAVALLLVVFLLGGGGVAAHSHDGLKREELRSVALSGGHDLPDTAAHVQSISLDVEPCPACCAAGRRLGALDASQPTLRSPLTRTQAGRAADDLRVSGFEALRPAPRGPPSV